jgi:tetratricopeptide (TPR) repeat protein
VLSFVIASFVIARNTAFTYKGKAVDAKRVGRELGVRYIVEGSVQRSANQIRVNAQLIDAETGSHLWAESFDRERGDLFAIEDELTKLIARTLRVRLLDIEARRAERRGTSADAMDYFMRGDALWYRPPLTKDSYRAMVEMYGRALQLDEHFSSARLGLSDALSGRVLNGFSDAPEDDLRRADELVSRVLADDPNRSYPHRLKGNILRAQKRFDEAMFEYETDIALDPTTANGRSHLALVKILIGEPAEAIPLLELVMRISPRDPLCIPRIQYRLGLANLLLGNTDEAIRWYEKAALTYYLQGDACRNLAAALSLKGDIAGAQAALAKAAQYNPHSSTLAEVRRRMYMLSDRPKFLALLERTVIEGLRKAGMPEQ